MSNFTFTATSECDRCGKLLASDEKCEACVGLSERRFHFEKIVNTGNADNNATKGSIETVWAINPIRAWDALHDVVDDVRPYRLCETGKTSLNYARKGRDVTDRDQLRTPGKDYG